mmetsp:Transcript_40970/g.96189  ORF Transcript_40970/g.96189 Transcript_40970/m.96189 type:complete len:161 (+) Transcript_40970:1396-1878(+)
MTSEIDLNRHNNKFNARPGKKKKKKKKNKHRKSSKARPGSEEELLELVSTLRSNVATSRRAAEISALVQYLLRHRHFEVGRELHHIYCAAAERIETLQRERIELDTRERARAAADGEGEEEEAFFRHAAAMARLECEEEVDALRWAPLDEELKRILDMIP